MKNKKRGVSMVTLVITVVVIIILALIAFSNSATMIEEANYSTLTSDFDEVKMALEEKVAILQGELTAQKKPIKKEQIYDYVAKGGATEDDFLKVEELPEYTIIDDLEKIGADVPERLVETAKGNLIPQEYAVTPKGEIFVWPPFQHEEKLYITPDDIIEDINQKEIIVGGDKININVNEETGNIEEGSVAPKEEIEDEEITPEVSDHEHDFRMQTTTDEYLASNATCQELATYYYKCTYCDAKGAATYPYGELQSHLYSGYTTTREPSCSETGLKVAKCAYCEEVKETTIEINPARHLSSATRTATEATCTETGLLEYYCPDCGVVTDTGTIPAMGHYYKNRVTTEPTCTTDGVKTFTCENCHDTYTQSIAKFGHNVVKDAAVKPTCTATGLTEGSHCTTCNGVIVEQTTIPATGHSPTPIAAIAATCTTDGLTEGSKCSVCRAILKEQTKVAAKGHSPVNGGTADVHTKCGTCGVTMSNSHSYSTSVASAATCTTKGTTKYTCSCGYNFTNQNIAINGSNHTGSVVNGGTSGVHTKYSCCGVTVSSSHSYKTTGFMATCTSQGYTKHECSCGYSYNTDYTTATGHIFDSASDLTCDKCGKVYTAYTLFDDDYKAKTGINVRSGNVVIPETFQATDGVWYKTIALGEEAFSVSSITSITLPNSITSIGKKAFYLCEDLISIDLPDGLTSIAEDTFHACRSLQTIDLPAGITNIGTWAFSGCESLRSIDLSNLSIKKIDEWTFSDCSSLNYVRLPNTLTHIADCAFRECESLISIGPAGSGASLELPLSVQTIDGAFDYCKSLRSVNLSTCPVVGGAFGNCTALTSVVLSDSLTRIVASTFQNCSSLTSIVLPASITELGQQAFGHCGSLASITFKGTVAQWNAISFAEFWDYNVPATYVQCSDGTVQLDGLDYDGCFALGTLITLADGTQKPIEEITYEDELLVWDFWNGEYTVSVPSLIEVGDVREYRIINLEFADGTIVRVIDHHGFFDVEENDFVFIDELNAADYIGHKFIKTNADGTNDTVELVGYTVAVEENKFYTILTAVHSNCVAEGMLTLTPPPIGLNGWYDAFEISEGMKYDEEQMQAEIDKYGLYTYEDFAEYITYEQFIAYNGPTLKILVGRGIITFEQILEAIAAFADIMM